MADERIRDLGKEDEIDLLYFNTLVNDSIKAIREFGPFEEFIDFDYGSRNEEDEMLIGFDDVPDSVNPVANALLLKGEER